MREDTKRLLRTWLLLMGLSVALAVAADVREPTRLTLPMLGAIALVIIAKCRLILADYLELRPHPGMLKGLLAMITVTVAIVVASFVPH